MVKCRFVVHLDSPIDDPDEKERYADHQAMFVVDGKFPFVPPIGMTIGMGWRNEFRVDSIHYDVSTSLLSVFMGDHLDKAPALRRAVRDGNATWARLFSEAHEEWSGCMHYIDAMSGGVEPPWGAFSHDPASKSEFVGVQPWASRARS